MLTGKLLHSVSYAGLWGQAFLDPPAVIRKAAELGYDGVMLMAKRPHVSILDYGPKERAALRAEIEREKLRHVVLAGYTNFTADMEHGDIPMREIQIAYVGELARLAHELGASKVRIFTGYDNPGAEYGRQWKLVVETLRECARRAAEFDVVLGVQNHHDLAAGWESLRDLIRAVGEPNCRAMYDAWAPGLHGSDLRRSAEAMAPLSVHTTVADYQLRPRFRYNPALINYEGQTPAVVAVPMGQGFLDYASFLSGLRKGGFRGTVAYEMCSPLADGGELEVLDRYARAFLQWLEDFEVRS